jgi:hypothetical protein
MRRGRADRRPGARAVARAALAWAALAGVLACAPVLESRDVPDAVGWLAVLELDARGGLVGASPLWRRAPATPLPIHVDASRAVVVVGFTTASLGALAAIVTSTETLSRADGCDPRLPAPVYAARLVDGVLVEALTDDVPALTAPWLADRCGLAGAPTVVVDCGATACLARATPTGERCTWNVDPTVTCGSPGLTVTLGPDDAVCFDDVGADACTRPARYAEPTAELLCERPVEGVGRSCHADVFTPPTAPPWLPPSETGAMITLADVTPFVPSSLTSFGDLRPNDAFVGYLGGLAILEDGGVRVTSASRLDGITDCSEQSGAGSWLAHAIEPARMLVTETSTVPECLGLLEPDPLGAGYAGLFRRDGAWTLGRFDPRGRELAAIALTTDLLAGRKASAVALRTIPATTRMVAMLTSDDATELFDVELTSMTIAHHWQLEETTWSFDFEDPRTIGFVVRRGATTCTIDVDRDDRPACIDAGCLVSEWSAFLYTAWEYEVHVETSRTVTSIGVAAEGVWICDAPEGPRSVPPYERRLQPGRMHPYPPDRSLLFVTGVAADGERWRTAVVLLDPVRGQFLPGTWSLDAGLATVVREDAEGDLWLMFPWDAKVSRLDLLAGPR